jgi:hypothetical protein
MTKLISPATAEQCDPEWIALRREIIQRDGHAIRPGPAHTIQVKGRESWDVWATLTLPNDVLHFATAEDRDAVLAKLST